MRSLTVASLIVLGTTLGCSGAGGSSGPASGGSAGQGVGGSTASGGSVGSGGSTGAALDHVVVHDPHGNPVAGVDVIFHDATGAALGSGKTGADGSAEVDAPEGGAITLIWKTPDETWKLQTELVTVTDLPASAELHVVADAFTDLQLRPYMILDFTPPPNGTPWNVSLPCLSEHDMYETQRQYRGCPGSDTFDVVVFYGGMRQVFANEKLAPGGQKTYTLDPTSAEAAPEMKVSLGNLPADVTYLGGTLQVPRDGGGWSQDTDGHNPQASPGPVLSFAELFAAPNAHWDLTVGLGDALEPVRQTLFMPLEGALPANVDWTLSDLAAIASVGPIAGTTARPVIPWTLASSGTTGDAIRVTYQYTLPGTSMVPDRRNWRIYRPADATSAELPDLPSAFASLAPTVPVSLALVEHLDLDQGTGALAAANAESDRVAAHAVWTSLSNE